MLRTLFRWALTSCHHAASMEVDTLETHMSASLFTEFVDVLYEGNQSRAAEALGIDRSRVCRMCNGSRSVSPAIALAIETLSLGRYTKEQFIWPDVSKAA